MSSRLAIEETTGQSSSNRSGRRWAIEISLSTLPRKAVFLLLILVPAALFIAQVTRIVLAATSGESLDPRRVQRAIVLDPGNPELHFKLGMLYLWGASPDSAAALRELRTATELNGNSAEYWSGLAKAALASNDQTAADRAFGRAAELAPYRPRYAWEAGVNYVVTDRPKEALVHLRHFVNLQPERASEAFDLLYRAYSDPDLVWNGLSVSSRDTATQMACLDFLSARSQFEFAAKRWGEIASTRPRLSLDTARPYLERLLAAGRYSEARLLWDFLQSSGTVRGSAARNDELVFNGGFEQEPANAGFDWRYDTQAFLAINFAYPSAHGGGRALRLDFTAPQNSEYEPLSQLVAVSPGESYLLTAYARSENLTSDSGPRLRVVDPRCPTCLNVTTEAVIGTTSWHQLRVQFTTPPATDAVRISLWRPRGRTFPMEISGQFWLDDVSLHAAR